MFTLHEVEEAYARLKLKPCVDVYFDGENHACPLGALVADRGGRWNLEAVVCSAEGGDPVKTINLVARLLSVTPAEALGFLMGFDGVEALHMLDFDPRPDKTSYELGRKAREHFLPVTTKE